ncbi:MAG: hypothetical protein ACHQJ6_04865, partial [Candidatus Berkiellales bacterium]
MDICNVLGQPSGIAAVISAIAAAISAFAAYKALKYQSSRDKAFINVLLDTRTNPNHHIDVSLKNSGYHRAKDINFKITLIVGASEKLEKKEGHFPSMVTN